MPRPKLGYLLFDLPGDHEIESSLATECKVIEALIHNRSLSARIKRICVASTEKFKKYPTYRLQVQFVHLACHGGKYGIGMLGERVSWSDVAEQIIRHLHKIKYGQKRIMVLSCCHSADGFKATKSYFKDYFTGIYYFNQENIPFSTAITIWSMFYLKKKLSVPHEAICEKINAYLGEQIIIYKNI